MRHLKKLIPLLLMALFALPQTALALDEAEMVKMLETIDDRRRNSGDWKSLAILRQKEKGKEEVLYEMVIYRRDADDKFMALFLAPKTDAGKGYLRLDKNLWFYAPSTGKWERRTERERIAGTDSRRSDFDQTKLAEEFTPSYVGEGKLGKFKTHKLKLAAKEGVDVAFPVVELEIDQASGNILKTQEFALSGRLMRTSYYPKWKKLFSESKGKDVWYPKEMRFYDELEKGNSTVISLKKVDLRSLDKNIFTKAWLETKSR